MLLKPPKPLPTFWKPLKPPKLPKLPPPLFTRGPGTPPPPGGDAGVEGGPPGSLVWPNARPWSSAKHASVPSMMHMCRDRHAAERKPVLLMTDSWDVGNASLSKNAANVQPCAKILGYGCARIFRHAGAVGSASRPVSCRNAESAACWFGDR